MFFIIIAYSKNTDAKTDFITSLCGALGLILWLSWIVFVAKAYSSDEELSDIAKSMMIGCGAVGLLTSVVIGSVFTIWFRNYFKGDAGLK